VASPEAKFNNISPPTADDKGAILNITARTGAFSAEEVATVGELLETYLNRPDHGGYSFLVYREEARILSFACYGPVPLTQGTYDLYWIAVDPDVKGRGFGRALLARVEAEVRAQGGRMLIVETSGRPDYEATRYFYERDGYTRAATLEDYYAPGDDLVIYRKRFDV
jgi:ribosomal protein S18 acetylase RimI-like enzyme